MRIIYVLNLQQTSARSLLFLISNWQHPKQEKRRPPRPVSLADAVYNISRSSLMTAALSAGRLDLISAAMQDRIHQPYRVPLVPGMSKILAEATSHGALGIALSGAGPTMIALVDRNDSRVEELSAYLVQTMKAEGISASCYPLNPVAEGVQLLEGINNRSFWI